MIFFYFFIFLNIIFSNSFHERYFVPNLYPISYFQHFSDVNSDTIDHNFVFPKNIIKINQLISKKYFYNWYDFNLINSSFKLISEIIIKENLRKITNGSILIRLSKNTFIQNDFEIDSDGFYDTDFSGKLSESTGKWTAHLNHSSLTHFGDWGHLFLGKTNLYFNNNSLLINSYHPPKNLLWWHLEQNNLEIDGSIIFLDSLNSKNRLIVFKRYGYKSSFLRFGFTELAILSYLNLNSDHISYLLPSSVLFEAEINEKPNANLLWLFDLKYKLNKYTLYFEFLIDDYAIDNKSPDKLGILFQLSLATDFLNYTLSYTRINRWVGNYFYPELRMIENNVLIGNQLGPDAHELKIDFMKKINEKLLLSYNISFQEKGASSIHDWPEGIASSQNFGYESEPFPSGNYKKQTIHDLNIFCYFKDSYLINLNFQNSVYDVGYHLKIGYSF